MTPLWIAIAVLSAGTVALLLIPLLRRPSTPAPTADYDLAVYRDQLAEVDRDLERDLIEPAQAEAARTEIQRRMLAAATVGDEAASAERAHPLVIGAVALLVPAGAVALYLTLGAPDVPDRPLAGRAEELKSAARAGGGGDRAADLATMVTRLRERLAADPNNPDGWQMLGRSLFAMDQPDEAVKAFERAVAVSERSADTLLSLAEARARRDDGRLLPDAVALVEEAYAKDSQDPRGPFFLGEAKRQAGEVEAALGLWAGLLTGAPADAPWREDLSERIRVVARGAGLDPAAYLPADAAAVGPTPEDLAAAADLSPDQQKEMIAGMVGQLEARLAENPDDVRGWQMLARSYGVLGQTRKVLEAQVQLERAMMRQRAKRAAAAQAKAGAAAQPEDGPAESGQ